MNNAPPTPSHPESISTKEFEMPNEAPTTPAPGQSNDAGMIAAASKEVKLPPFCAAEAVAWFHRAEIQFRLKKVTDPGTKADYVMASLPEEIFPRMTDWIEENSDEEKGTVDYKALKQELLRKFVLSPEERAEKLLALTKQPLGDQRPFAAYQEMRMLSKVPDGEGKMKSIHLVAVLWLLRLPDRVRQGIPRFSHMSDAELEELADSLMSTYRQTTSEGTFAVREDDESEGEQIAAATNRGKRNSGRHYNKQKPPRSMPPRMASQPTLCKYHRRFGSDAWSCAPPCSWSKNL